MPWDIHLPFDWNESGDAETVTREEFYVQVVTIAVSNAAESSDSRGGPMTATNVADLESRINDEVAASPYVTGEPVTQIQAVADRELTLSVRLPLSETTMDLTTTVDL